MVQCLHEGALGRYWGAYQSGCDYRSVWSFCTRRLHHTYLQRRLVSNNLVHLINIIVYLSKVRSSVDLQDKKLALYIYLNDESRAKGFIYLNDGHSTLYQ